MLDVIDDIWAVEGFQVSDKDPRDLVGLGPGLKWNTPVKTGVIKRNEAKEIYQLTWNLV